MTQHSRTHTALKNSSYRLFGYFMPMIFSVIATPVIVNSLGVKQYGLMVFVNSLFGILGLLDMGVSTATIKHIAEYRGTQNTEGSVRTVRTANSLFMIIGLVGVTLVGLAVSAVALFYPDKLANNPEALWIVAFAAGSFLVNTLNSIYVLIPSAYERFDISTKISSFNIAASSIGSLAAVLLGGTLVHIFAVQFLLICVFSMIWRTCSLRIFPLAAYAFGWSKDEVRRSVAFSGYASLNELARTSLFSLDRLLMPLYLGAAQLTYYTIPGNLTARIPGISDAISGVLFPLSAHLNASGDVERLRTAYVRSSRLMLLVSSAVAASLAFNATAILTYWINPEVAANGAKAMIILAGTNFVLAILSPVASFFMTLGRWKFYTSVSASMAMVNLVALLILMPKYGINGAAVAYLISTLPILYAAYRLEHVYLGVHKVFRRWSGLALKIGVTTVAFAVFNTFLIKPFITGLPSLIILGPLSVLSYALIYAAFGFIPRDDRSDIANFIRHHLPWKKS
jgi:O-antigen/teichoic acid export membrane protein